MTKIKIIVGDTLMSFYTFPASADCQDHESINKTLKNVMTLHRFGENENLSEVEALTH
jgi:hypothetical protein